MKATVYAGSARMEVEFERDEVSLAEVASQLGFPASGSAYISGNPTRDFSSTVRDGDNVILGQQKAGGR